MATGATTAVATTVMHPQSSPAAHGQAVHSASGPSAATTTGLTGRGSAHTIPTDAVPVTKGFMALVNRLGPALVSVDTQGPEGTRHGTGLVLTTNGMIMTAASVVDHQQTIDVVTSSGHEWAASLVGHDPMTGIAVVRMQDAPLTPAPLGTANGLVPGQLTVAVFSSLSPYGKPSVVVGSVQAVQNTVTLANGSQLVDGIETDVPAVDEQPGGVLLDEKGDVVGIVQGTAETSNGAMLVATPIDDASSAASQLAATGHVVRAYLGILGRNVLPGDQTTLGTSSGVEVEQVTAKSPAAIAGLQPGQVIVAFNGQPVGTVAVLQHQLDQTPPNTTVTISLVDHQVPRTVRVTLGVERE